jgi:hypothetical protein
MKCLCCNKDKELRFGVCFDCAEIQSIIVDGTDMRENGLKEDNKPAKTSLEKVKLLRERGYHKHTINNSVND